MPATTKMEKGLLKAIENASAEVLEEMEALASGTDSTSVISSVQSILQDLMNYAQHFESYEDEEILDGELAIEMLPESFTGANRFSVGDKAVINETRGFLNDFDSSLYKKAFSHFRESLPQEECDFEEGTIVEVIAKAVNPYSDNGDACYVIEVDGERGLVTEYALDEYTEPSETDFLFGLGEVVRIKGKTIDNFADMKRLFGDELEDVFTAGTLPFHLNVKILDRREYPLCPSGKVYAVRLFSSIYFACEEQLRSPLEEI